MEQIDCFSRGFSGAGGETDGGALDVSSIISLMMGAGGMSERSSSGQAEGNDGHVFPSGRKRRGGLFRGYLTVLMLVRTAFPALRRRLFVRGLSEILFFSVEVVKDLIGSCSL
ncbi:hypothetical protein R1sor_006487 [Riccia sorocarpa]|uniref:Uncharacterized protein n=1 Tax=Riccia sorocarpa TaxID=122646 RepID=A0ABD3HPG3_9MARC